MCTFKTDSPLPAALCCTGGVACQTFSSMAAFPGAGRPALSIRPVLNISTLWWCQVPCHVHFNTLPRICHHRGCMVCNFGMCMVHSSDNPPGRLHPVHLQNAFADGEPRTHKLTQLAVAAMQAACDHTISAKPPSAPVLGAHARQHAELLGLRDCSSHGGNLCQPCVLASQRQ